MNVKARKTKKQVNVENQAINLLSKEELNKKTPVYNFIYGRLSDKPTVLKPLS